MHSSSLKLMTYFRDKYLKNMEGATVLDIGSRRFTDMKTYREIFEPNYKYTGMDVESGDNVDIVGYENITGIFDIVISGQTMEHVTHPWDWLLNLVPYFSSYICIISPRRWKEHRCPLDTYRYYPDGMRDLFSYAGIKELEIIGGRVDTVGIGTKPESTLGQGEVK